MIEWLTNFQILSLEFEGGFDTYEVTATLRVRAGGLHPDFALRFL